jgi:hypothetical protein
LGGFHDILSKLRDETISFRKPVVLVHGDSHYFMIDKPLLDADGRRVENFTRVETFGDHTFSAHPEWDTNDVHWVKALVDPQSRDVFAFRPQVVTSEPSGRSGAVRCLGVLLVQTGGRSLAPESPTHGRSYDHHQPAP